MKLIGIRKLMPVVILAVGFAFGGAVTPARAADSAAQAAAKTGSLIVTIYDGTRKPITSDTQILVRVFDHNQHQVESGFYSTAVVKFDGLLRPDDPAEPFTVVASTNDYNTAGVAAVRVLAGVATNADVLLLPNKGEFIFEPWSLLKQTHPALASLMAQGASSDEEAERRYNLFIQDDPGAVAAFLNILTGTDQMDLPEGTLFSFFKQLVWEKEPDEWANDRSRGFNPFSDSENAMRHDRFWAWTDARIVNQVKIGQKEGLFFFEHGYKIFHHGATGSYKEKPLSEGHLHISFYQNSTRVIDGVPCILVEIHIDLYKDLLAHGILEVLPNTLLRKRTQPEHAYQHRWNAATNTHYPPFNPPFVIVSSIDQNWHPHKAQIKK